MASLKELLNQRVQNLESKPLTFVNGIESELVRKMKEMTNLLSSLEVNSQGQIINTAENLAKINQITEGIGDIYVDEQYVQTLRTFAQDFDSQLNLNKELLSTLGDFTDDELFRQTMRAGQNTTVNALSRTAVNTHLLDPVREMLTTSVVTNSKFSDAVDFLKTQIGLNPDIDSRWTRHAKQIAFDSFAISDRQVADLMARNNGYDHFLYYGTVKDTTRCFCRDRNLNVYSEEEFKEWGRRENIGECDTGGGWQGMNDATNEDNIRVFMGGWNCRHVAMAVQEGFQLEPNVIETEQTETKTFVPAKSVKEAEQFAIDNGFAKRVDYGGMDLQNANTINESLLKMRGSIPNTMSSLNEIGTKQNTGTAIAQFSHSDNKIVFNRYIASAKKNADDVVKLTTDETTKKLWAHQDGLGDVAVHEFGHARERRLFDEIKKLKLPKHEEDDIFDSWFGRTRKIFNTMDKTTAYGSTERGEMIAEAFVEVFKFGNNAGRYAKEIEKLFSEFTNKYNINL